MTDPRQIVTGIAGEVSRVYQGRMPRRLRAHGLVVFDQALSSLSNMLVTVIVAHAVSLTGLGQFAIAYTVYTFALGLTRAYVQEPMLITYGTVAVGDRETYVMRAYGAAFTIGLAVAICGVVLAWPLRDLRSALVPISMMAPFLLLQDVVRYDDFARRASARAIASDVLWLGAFAVAGFQVHGLLGVTVAWGATGVASAVLVRPKRCMTAAWHALRLSWFVDHRASGGFFVMDFILGQAVQQCSVWFTGAFASFASAGAYRAGQICIAPIRTLNGALTVSLIPQMVGGDTASIVKKASGFARFNALAAVVTAGALVLLPAGVGRVILGGAWNGGREVGVVLSLAMAVSAVAQSRMLIIKATQNFHRSVKVRLFTVPVSIALILAGTLLAGAVGAAGGFVAAATIGMVWWTRVARICIDDALRIEDQTA